MDFDRFSKILFFTVVIAVGAGSLVLFGIYSAYYKTPFFQAVEGLANAIKTDITAFRETSFARPDNLLQPARYPGSGVTINSVKDEGEYILISGFFDKSNEIRLIKRNGTILKRWPLSFSRMCRI